MNFSERKEHVNVKADLTYPRNIEKNTHQCVIQTKT